MNFTDFHFCIREISVHLFLENLETLMLAS